MRRLTAITGRSSGKGSGTRASPCAWQVLTPTSQSSDRIGPVGERRFKGRHGIVKAKGAVDVQPGAAALPDVPMLVLLGWYLILLHAEDATAATSVAAASSVATVAVISST